jgi:hypothetical protein
MKPKTTGIWFVLAASLFAFIWLYQSWLRPAVPVITPLLPDFHALNVTALSISPAGAREISVVRTNGNWQLESPLVYPAQTAAIEALAGALEKLVPATRLTADKIRANKNADLEFGFDNPQFRMLVKTGDQQRQLLIGKLTAPGDQVYVRVVGVDGAFVTDAGWLALLPHSANDWRDTSLIDGAGECNWIVITNGTKAMEFRRNTTNQLWRMIRPLQARADSARLAAAFQQLRAGRVTKFITDDPRADLSSYGLQPADLSVWLGQGTNMDAGVEAGKSTPDDAAQVFARRAGWNAVVTANKDAFAGWRGTVIDYRDPHLLTLTTPAAEIEVHGSHPFTLQQRGSNDWAVVGEKFSADTESVQQLLKMLTSLRVSEFVKDVPTAASYEDYGLTNSSREITLLGTAGDTNSVLAQLIFGASETNRVFVKRADEDFVYAITPSDYNNLFAFDAGWFYRDRHIWNFPETNVTQVTLHQNGKTRVLVRTGENKWSFGAGSQGIINPPAVEEAVHQLGELTVAGWVTNNIVDPIKNYGLDPRNLSITVELNTGEKFSVDFGAELAKNQTALAAVTLDGERWAFIFPPVPYQYVTQYLTIPTNAP